MGVVIMTKEERYEKFKDDMWEAGYELYSDGEGYLWDALGT